MSQTGTPTEFLKLGITEPDDTLNVLVDLNRQWEKIDTGVKNVDTKANTNASGISALNTAVQDNTENITNILETNVNQQTSIDTLQSKVATLEQDDTSYGSRITAVEAGVQENSELINDLEVDLSGVKTSVGTVPSGSTLQGQVDGLDTKVTTLETEVGTVPAGETVQGQITTLNGQVNSGNIPFRFSVDGGGNYGYLKADDSFVPFRSGDSHWHELDTGLYRADNSYSFIVKYYEFYTTDSPYYLKLHDLINNVDYTLTSTSVKTIVGRVLIMNDDSVHILNGDGTISDRTDSVVGVSFDNKTRYTHLLTKTNNTFYYNVYSGDGVRVGKECTYTLRGNTTKFITFIKVSFYYRYNNTSYLVEFNTDTGVGTDTEVTNTAGVTSRNSVGQFGIAKYSFYNYQTDSTTMPKPSESIFDVCPEGEFLCNISNNYYYYI